MDNYTTMEDQAIFQAAVSMLENDGRRTQTAERDHTALNEKLQTTASDIHSSLLSDLIYTYVCGRFGVMADRIMNILFESQRQEHRMIHDTDIESIPMICEALHIRFLNSKFVYSDKSHKIRLKSKERLIESGSVYTQPDIARIIIGRTIPTVEKDMRILDFACGTGRFYENIINLFDDKRKAVLTNVYALDIDKDALSITRLKALTHLDEVNEEDCKAIASHIVLRNGLMGNNHSTADRTVSGNDMDVFADESFDAIVSNPPYLVLKPDKSKRGASNRERIMNMASYYRRCGNYHLAIEGMLNLYQLSIERMLQMLKPEGRMGIICPSTLFGDLSASKLREHLLSQNNVKSIEFFPEKAALFENVSQATCIFVLEKGGVTEDIVIRQNGETFPVALTLIKELFPRNLEIPAIRSGEWEILKKLMTLPRLKDLEMVRNRRGELDLTLCKKYITRTETPYRLVRGKMIGTGEIREGDGEYVAPEFISTRTNDYITYDFNRRRLICQQISNGGQKRRLKFAICEPNDILGNSCNYISADERVLEKLYMIMNSSIMNWRFKVTSSNNHINNYELDELPIVDLDKVNVDLVQHASPEEADDYIASLYGLNDEEKQLISL